MKNLSCQDLSDYLNLKQCLIHLEDHDGTWEVTAVCFVGVLAGFGSLHLVLPAHFSLHHLIVSCKLLLLQ
jgi:hypothetical protein